jgi:hypothetical protein
METFLIISNIGFFILSLSLGYPKGIQVYRKWKKQRETQAFEGRQREIHQIVDAYLKSLIKEEK